MHVISQIVETENDRKEPDVRQWSRIVVIEIYFIILNTRLFWIKSYFSFLLSIAEWTSDYFDIKGMRGKQFGKGEAKLFGVNSQIMGLICTRGFFSCSVRDSCSGRKQIGALEGLVWSAVCQTNRQFYFAGESGKGVAFLNGKWHVLKIKNGHWSPLSKTYVQQL